MKKKVYLISWYFPSFPGGAEKSILEELKKYKKNNFEVFVISFDEGFRVGNFNIGGVKGYNYKLKYLFNFSRYYTFFLGRTCVLDILSRYNFHINDLILVQGILTPIISNFCLINNLKYNYYIRDENNLNEFNNYWTGIKKYAKYIKDLVEFIPLKNYKFQNSLSLINANKIISNSKFISNLLKSKFNLNSDIIYPSIDLSKLKNTKIDKSKQKYITFIGGHNAMKGYDIVLKIAKAMPNFIFLVVGPYKSEFTKNNITFIPWKKDVLDIYKLTKILIVPSRWNEAYGRIVIEANFLHIPVICSNKGGLDEANINDELIIDNFENINMWVNKILRY
jgi:glycosyltransferase involved in cell wall biosynthesis